MLIFWCNRYLVVHKVAIKLVVVLLSSKPVEHLINERQKEVVFHCRCIQLATVHAYPPSCDYPHWNQFILIICTDNHPSFLKHIVDWTDPITISDWVDYPASTYLMVSFFTTTFITGFNRL